MLRRLRLSPSIAIRIAATYLVIATGISSTAAEPPGADAKPYSPKIAPASSEPERARSTIAVPPGLAISLFAAEPMIANPVAFHFDERGRAYVAETFRLHAGVTDTRNHMIWLDDDLACRTVEDRLAMYRKYLGKDFDSYGAEHDRVRFIEDSNGDGKADRATVFADGFKNHVDGLGSGVLARGGEVYYACIPDLWLLKDKNGDGEADDKRSLHRGYGVHVNFLGHDLHGLQMGPDGRLYFSIGDRGLNVETPKGRLFLPDTGAILRCEPDGSSLEIYASGLRNPQELVFDDFGNLFTCDNNSDSGDKARWVHLVEGGDSGWRIGYQYIQTPVARGPWNAEKLWYPRWEGQAAYILPPLANVSDGPSGLTRDPGVTTLPAEYRGRFFLADFRGTVNLSGVRSVALKPNGASFEVADDRKFVWSLLATDVDFGPDGGLYVSDWVEGWEMTGKGRLWRFADPGRNNDPAVLEVKRLLGEGMSARPVEELRSLLGHADQRVRLEAQYALAARGASSEAIFSETVLDAKAARLARVHALWGLGQIARKHSLNWKSVASLLEDPDAEVRAQAAKVLGDGRASEAGESLTDRLKDDEARVRYFAAIAIARLGRVEAFDAVLEMLKSDAGRDPYLRHAGVMALTSFKAPDRLAALADRDEVPLRLAAVVALRRLGSPAVSRFLKDRDDLVAVEAARAVHDELIEKSLPDLAAAVERPKSPEPLARRALAAIERLGGAENAERLAGVAKSPEPSASIREEALRILGAWPNPSGRDRVNGLWRPIAARSSAPASTALTAIAPGLLRSGTESIRRETLRALASLGVKDLVEEVKLLVIDLDRPGATRAEALRTLGVLSPPGDLEGVVLKAIDDASSEVRAEALRLLAKVDPALGMPALAKVLAKDVVEECRNAYEILGSMNRPEADRLLAEGLDRLLAGKLRPELELDLTSASEKRAGVPEIANRLATYGKSHPESEPLKYFASALVGGNSRNGRRIFSENVAASCVRCHKLRGQGGEVGPDLTGIGAKQSREYLLEAIVAPNKAVAKGFESVVLAMADGSVVSGVMRSEDEKEIRLVTAEGQVLTVAKKDVDERKPGISAMPEDVVKRLNRFEIRDLVEFLSRLR